MKFAPAMRPRDPSANKKDLSGHWAFNGVQRHAGLHSAMVEAPPRPKERLEWEESLPEINQWIGFVGKILTGKPH